MRQYAVLLHSILNTVFGAKLPAYSVVISIDRSIREFPIPTNLRLFRDAAEDRPPVVPIELDMRRFLITSRKEMSSYKIHSCYFSHTFLSSLFCVHSAFAHTSTVLFPSIARDAD
jgi:hypothetical protein